MISQDEVLRIYQLLIERFGGAHGVRDMSLLESAVSRPFQTFDSSELYPTVLEKAAALIESILTNHPFVDGNKRTGYTLLRLFLLKYDLDVRASEEEKYQFVIQIAEGQLRFDDILSWLQKNTVEGDGR